MVAPVVYTSKSSPEPSRAPASGSSSLCSAASSSMYRASSDTTRGRPAGFPIGRVTAPPKSFARVTGNQEGRRHARGVKLNIDSGEGQITHRPRTTSHSVRPRRHQRQWARLRAGRRYSANESLYSAPRWACCWSGNMPRVVPTLGPLSSTARKNKPSNHDPSAAGLTLPQHCHLSLNKGFTSFRAVVKGYP